jgi:hypothetical protein
MEEHLKQIAEQWIGYKIWLVDNIGLSNDALHVHVSILILFVSGILLRRRPDSIWCWLIVLIAELFNEYADVKGLAPGEASIEAGLHDLYNTMLVPTVLLIFGRLLFPPRAQKLQENADAEMLSPLLSDFANKPLEQTPTV